MFSKLTLVATVAFAVFASASPLSTRGECSTGDQVCCNTFQKASSPQAQEALGALAAEIGADVPIGLTCSPITALGLAGGSSCSQQPVCCNNDNFTGLIAIGCTPINIAL